MVSGGKMCGLSNKADSKTVGESNTGWKERLVGQGEGEELLADS